MGSNKRVVIGLILLGLVSFVITFCIRSWQIDNEVKNLTGAVQIETEEPSIDISALKVGYDGKTYTLDEFVELDEIPVVVDILIMQADGTLDNKQAYVSFADDSTDSIQYIDGVYGRLILPMEYNKGE